MTLNFFQLHLLVSALLAIIGAASLIQMALRLASPTNLPNSSSGSGGDSDDSLLLAVDESESKGIISSIFLVEIG
eukprot:COSAG06_NODE_47009_length_342_cov_1.246914_1_plen_75_part_00